MKRNISALLLLAIGLTGAYFFFKGSVILGIVFSVLFILVGLYLLGVSDEKKEAADKNVLDVTKNSAYGAISENGNFDFDTAKKVREELLNNFTPTDASMEINIAAGLMLDKDFAGSIKAYEQVMEKYPSRKGECLGQIGAAEFFLGNYEKALDKYIEAKNSGEDNEMMEYNIWEVCELMHNNGTAGYMEKYISLYPQGKFIKKANKLLA